MCNRSRSMCKGNGHQRQARGLFCAASVTRLRTGRRKEASSVHQLAPSRHASIVNSFSSLERFFLVAFHYYFCHKAEWQTIREYSILGKVPTRLKDTSHAPAAPQAVHSSKSCLEASNRISKSKSRIPKLHMPQVTECETFLRTLIHKTPVPLRSLQAMDLPGLGRQRQIPSGASPLFERPV
jgi:hypothetical protein